MKLMNKTKNTLVADSVEMAKTLPARLKGLIGRQELPENGVLWISNCPSIHTFFMNFTIDAVFVDKKMN